MLSMTIELLPIGFYLILSFTLLDKKVWLVSIGLLLCLLSRYALVLWIPLYLLVYYYKYPIRKTFRSVLLVSIGILLFFIIPFLSKDWSSFQKGIDNYDVAAKGQWHLQSWQNENEKPFHLGQGLGMSIYFYDYQSDTMTLDQRFALNKKFHLLISILCSIFLLLTYIKFKDKFKNKRLFLLASLKIYLVLFYSFIIIPFDYLFQLPLFMTIPILYELDFDDIFQKKN